MDIENHPDVIRVLEWAEATARRTNDPELYLDRLPPELRPAITVCEARGWVQVFGLGAKFILLSDQGAGKLAEHRLAATTPPGKTNEQPVKPKAERGKRRQSKPRPLTPKQTEALQIVGECRGDIAEAARRLGKDRKTVEQHYQAGLAKLGQAVGRKPKAEQLQNGLRGQPEVTAEDDRRARIRPVDRRRTD